MFGPHRAQSVPRGIAAPHPGLAPADNAFTQRGHPLRTGKPNEHTVGANLADKIVRITIHREMSLSVVDHSASSSPQRCEDFRERTPQMRSLRSKGEDIFANIEGMHIR